ncbi:MAG: IS110 family transposase [Candidatus Diapherotrites archaeon]
MTFYAGLDVHKEHINAAVVDSRGKIVKEAKFMNTPEALDAFISGLSGDTEFALEACGFYEPVYDWIDDRGRSVSLCHPKKVKAIASAKIKTDVIDARTIAQLKRVDLLPESYVPPKHVREIRSIVRHRASLTRQRANIRRSTHSVLHRHGIKQPFSDLFGKAGIEWLKRLDLPYAGRMAVDNYLAIHASMSGKIEVTTASIKALVDANPDVKMLTTMPGIGEYSALFVTTEVGDIKRFPNSEKLCAYAGLVPSVHQSARTLRRGHITKEGNKLLRWILIQCAHKAVVSDPHLRKKYMKLKCRLGANKAVVGIARKMLCYLYVMLTERREWRTLSVNSPGGKEMG